MPILLASRCAWADNWVQSPCAGAQAPTTGDNSSTKENTMSNRPQSYSFSDLATRTATASGTPAAKCNNLLTEIFTQYRQAAAADDMDAIRALTNNGERSVELLSGSIGTQQTGGASGD